MHFVVLSSSKGTTFQAVLDALKDGSLHATCAGLITDRADRGCLSKAKAAGLPSIVLTEDPFRDRIAFEKGLDEAVRGLFERAGARAGQELIAAIGWMWILSPEFIEKWKNRIINVHPALLPTFGGEGMYGLHVHEAVLKAGEKESGVTFHLIDSGIDTGKILLQKRCAVERGDTPATLQKRVQALEKEWYPKVLQMIDEGVLKV
jgi:phosphoribosylglycinamide formyltransferase-1